MDQECRDVWYSEKQREIITSIDLQECRKSWHRFAKLEDGSIVEHTTMGSKPNFDDVVYLGKGCFHELQPLESSYFKIYNHPF